MSAFGVYERKGSPFYWIWYGAGKARKMESSRKRRDDPLGWKQAFDLARIKGADAVGRTSPDEARFDAWVEEWLDTLHPSPEQKGTKRTLFSSWRFLRAYLSSHDVVEPADVTYAMGQDYYIWRRRHARHPAQPRAQTARKEIALLRRILFEAVQRGFIAANPLAQIRIPKAAHAEKPEISEEEEAIIRRTIAGMEKHLPIEDRWMNLSFIFSIRQGWRISETSFPLTRVNWDKNEVLIRSKGNKWRTVPLHPEVRELLDQVRAAGRTQSITFPKNSSQAACTAWSKLLRGVDRDGIVGILPHLCFHCCRVTCISRLGRAGVPERLCMEFVGHWSITSHRIYSRVAHDDLARCIFPTAPSSATPPSPSPETGANV